MDTKSSFLLKILNEFLDFFSMVSVDLRDHKLLCLGKEDLSLISLSHRELKRYDNSCNTSF
jgi:hypothetical protein